jgi:uncharacterized protein (TIGR03067 family)
MSKLHQLLSAVVVGLVASAGFADDKTGSAGTKIDGTYTLVSGERDGKPMADADVKDCKVTITADKITGTSKDGKEFLNATYTVDDKKDETKREGQKTCHITLKSGDGKTYKAMCEKTADGLKMVYHLDGGEEPTEFKTKDKQVMLVLKSSKG